MQQKEYKYYLIYQKTSFMIYDYTTRSRAITKVGDASCRNFLKIPNFELLSGFPELLLHTNMCPISSGYA